MKTTIYIGALSFLLIFVFIRGTLVREKSSGLLPASGLEYPVKVKAVIDQKCYGCHSAQGKSADAKEALLWDDLPSHSKSKQVGKLDDIISVLNDGSMPPEKYVEKNPSAKLTKDEMKILKSWAEETAENLMK